MTVVVFWWFWVDLEESFRLIWRKDFELDDLEEKQICRENFKSCVDGKTVTVIKKTHFFRWSVKMQNREFSSSPARRNWRPSNCCPQSFLKTSLIRFISALTCRSICFAQVIFPATGGILGERKVKALKMCPIARHLQKTDVGPSTTTIPNHCGSWVAKILIPGSSFYFHA